MIDRNQQFGKERDDEPQLLAQLLDLLGLIEQGGPAPPGPGAPADIGTADLALPTKAIVTIVRRIYAQMAGGMMNADEVQRAIIQLNVWLSQWEKMIDDLQRRSDAMQTKADTFRRLYDLLLYVKSGQPDVADAVVAEATVYKPRLRRGLRKEFNREEHEKTIARYQNDLSTVFQDWLVMASKRGSSPSNLADRLYDLAESYYLTGFLKGKKQAYPAAKLTDQDKQKIYHELKENRRFLETSLLVDINQKAHDQNLHDDPEDFVATLKGSFDSRIRNLYGGRLWSIIESGYIAGVREVRHRMRAYLASIVRF